MVVVVVAVVVKRVVVAVVLVLSRRFHWDSCRYSYQAAPTPVDGGYGNTNPDSDVHMPCWHMHIRVGIGVYRLFVGRLVARVCGRNTDSDMAYGPRRKLVVNIDAAAKCAYRACVGSLVPCVQRGFVWSCATLCAGILVPIPGPFEKDQVASVRKRFSFELVKSMIIS